MVTSVGLELIILYKELQESGETNTDVDEYLYRLYDFEFNDGKYKDIDSNYQYDNYVFIDSSFYTRVKYIVDRCLSEGYNIWTGKYI